MMGIGNIQNWTGMTDGMVVSQIGAILKQMRLQKNLTQQQLANDAGLDRSTISQLENGRAATLLTFVQVLRVLGKLAMLNDFVSEPQISPLEYAKLQGKKRKRATSKKRYKNDEEDIGW